MSDLQRVSRSRWRVGLALTLLMIVIYFGFILLVAFGKSALATPLVPGLTLGIVLGAGVIVSAWIVTGIYVWWANNRYDPALRAALDHDGDRMKDA